MKDDEDDLFGSFKDLFGNKGSKLFEDIFGNIPGSEDKPEDEPENEPETRKEALLRTFRIEVDNGDIVYLEDVVVRYSHEVSEQSDTPLFKAHALASIYVNNYPVAYSSLTKLNKPSLREKELMGIVANLLEKYDESITHIYGTEMTSPLSRVALSLSLYNQFQISPGTHESILEPLTEESAAANTIVGVLYFNSGDIDDADIYFTRAAELSPKSSSIRLNELRTRYKRGMQSEVFASLNPFYTETGCSLSADEIIAELDKDEIKLPELQIRGRLYDVARSLMR